MSNEEPRATFRDPVTNEMKYAIGFTEGEAAGLKHVVDGMITIRKLTDMLPDPQLQSLSERFAWVLATAAADKSQNEVP